jgi:predicted DNA-binding protein with PD1-like motif
MSSPENHRASDNASWTLPVRLKPGDDLRRALERIVASQGVAAAFVVSGIGSLRPAAVRFAGAESITRIDTDTEVLTLSGTIDPSGSHLHLCASDDQGRVVGGHAGYGCTVRTTAEVLLTMLPAWQFSREPDADTGYDELVIRRSGEA